MRLLKDTFAPKRLLPAHISHNGMEVVLNKLGAELSNGSILVEIGDDRELTSPIVKELLDDHFPELLEEAIEKKCEYISFYI